MKKKEISIISNPVTPFEKDVNKIDNNQLSDQIFISNMKTHPD